MFTAEKVAVFALIVAVSTLMLNGAIMTAVAQRDLFLRADKGSHFIWKRRNDLPTKRSDFALVSNLQLGFVYLVAGCAQDSTPECPETTGAIWQYDTKFDTYSDIQPLSTPRYRHGAALLGNELIVFGGLATPMVTANTTEIINLTTGQKTVLPGGPIANLFDFTTFTIGNNIYVAGGYNDTTNYYTQSATYVYNRTANTWTFVANLNTPRGDAASTVAVGKGYVVGGWSDANNWEEPLATMEEFNPQTNTFTVSTDVLQPGRGDAAFCTLRARLFLFGGENPSQTSLDEVEVLSLNYTSVTSQDWHYAGELPVDRFRFGCASMDYNSVFVFGGQTRRGSVNGSNFLETSIRVDEFIEQRIFEDLESRLETPLIVSGSRALAPFVYSAAHVVQTMSRSPVRILYRAIETAKSQTGFIAAPTYIPTDDFYVGEGPLSTAKFNELKNVGHHIIQFPLALGAVRIFHNLQTTTPLQIDACGLAKIFSGQTLQWTDIFGTSTGVPDVIMQVRRLPLESGLTSALKAYLSSACPSQYSATGFDSLPIIGGAGTFNHSLDVPASICYTSRGYFGPLWSFPEVALINAAGQAITADSADLRTSLPPLQTNFTSDISQFNFINANSFNSYPIVVVFFAYVRQDQTFNAQTGQLLEAFLKFLVSDRGQSFAIMNGVYPLSQYWAASAAAAISNIRTSPDSAPYAWDQIVEPVYSLVSSREDRYTFDQAILLATQSQVTGLLQQQQSPVGNSDNSGSSAVTNNVAIAGLVIACVGFLLALYAACKVRSLARLAAATPTAGINDRHSAQYNGASAASKYQTDHIQVV